MNTNKKRHPAIWGFTTYFAEGFPYTIIRQISSLFLRDRGVALESIGLTSLFGLPWILKFLWAPLLDRYGTKRQWMILMQTLLTLVFVITSIVAPLPTAPMIIATLFFVGSFFASTNDIAIDGYYLETLNCDGQAAYVGYRVMAYRIAMIFGTGIIGTIGPTAGWLPAFAVGTILFGAITLFHYFYLEDTEKAQSPIQSVGKIFLQPKALLTVGLLTSCIVGIQLIFRSNGYTQLKELYPLVGKFSFSYVIALLLILALVVLLLFRKKLTLYLETHSDSFYAKAYLSFIDRPKIGTIFTAIIFIRTGEFMLSSMVAPFFVDLGIKVHYGWISGTMGLVLSICGAIAGGALIKKYGLKKLLWPFLLLQNFTNLIYMAIAFYLSPWIEINSNAVDTTPIGTINISIIALVQGFDQFAGGLGTAVLTLLLMRLCIGEFKAAHYAIGTAFMSVSGVIAGIFGGILAENLGYAWFFGVSFLFSVPGMIAVFYLPTSVIQEQ